MCKPVCPTTSATEEGADSDPLNIDPDAKKEEEPEASPTEDEKKEASVGEKEPRKETIDDPPVSVRNDTNPTAEEAHENDWSISTDENGLQYYHVRSVVPLKQLRAGLIKTDEIRKELIQKTKDLASFDPHFTTEPAADKPPSVPTRACTEEAPAALNSMNSQEFQFATDSQKERKNNFLPRHNSGTEKERPESSKGKEFPDSKIDKKESAKEETDYQNFETTRPVTEFDDLPDLVLLQIFKQLGARDKLRLEGVNMRWNKLLIESWRDVRVLDVWDIYSPSLTDDDIEFLRSRVSPFVKRLDFGTFHWDWPDVTDSTRTGQIGTFHWDWPDWPDVGTFHWDWPEDKDEEDKLAIARKIFLSLSSPPCALEEVVLWDGMFGQSTLSSLIRIGHQITSITVRMIPTIDSKPEDPIEDSEERRSFFALFPNLKRLKCTFPGVYDFEKHVSCQWDALPSSLEYMHLQCWGDTLMADDNMIKQFFQLEESLCSLRELHLTEVEYNEMDETILSGLVIRFPNLEVLEIEGSFAGVELLAPLKKLRELYLAGDTVNLQFLSRALSFEFRENLEIFHFRICDGFLPQEQLENLSCFPNLKDIRLREDQNGRMELNVVGLEKIVKGCKKLRRISFDPCKWLNDEGLRILGENCPDLRFLDLEGCGGFTWEEGIKALVSGISNPKDLKISVRRTEHSSENSGKMIDLMVTYEFV